MWKCIIALRSRVILNRRIRRHWKYIQNHRKINEIVEKSVWGVSYSVFDGEELLEASLKSIRDSVDYVNVVYQKHSWYGKSANPQLLPLLKRLQKSGLIDDLIEYIPNYKMRAGKQETLKRNIGLKYAKKRGVDYFMCMDTDEFYIKQEVEKAKNYIVKHSVSRSFCPVVAYISPTCRMFGSGGYVQFFSRIGLLSKLKQNRHNVALVDPTRQLNHLPFVKYFVLPSLEMHHMTGVRKDINKKFINSSFNSVNNINAEDFYKKLSSNCITVPNMFKIKGIK